MKETNTELSFDEVKALERYRVRKARLSEPTIKKNKYPKMGYKKDPENLHMYVTDVRILTPAECEALKAAIPTDRHRTMFEILLITGMRYAEFLRLHENKVWYNANRNIIHLPEEAQLKHKRKQQERTIMPLPYGFDYFMRAFWAGEKPPLEATWNKNMQRWAVEAGIKPYGLSVKTTRKTIESWQIVAGISETTVCLRAGHDSVTSMKHYQGLAFSDSEIQDIKKKLTEWSILKQ